MVGIFVILAVVVGSMVLHELAHGFVAYLLGDDTAKEEGRLSLNPVKHLDPILSIAMPLLLYIAGMPVFGGAKPVPVNSRNLKFREWGMALVAVAGPLMNFILAFLGFVAVHLLGGVDLESLGGMALRQIVFVNLGFGIFNLIPIPPLDGSRILYAIAPDGAREIMQRIESVGFVVIYVMIFALGGVFSQLMGGAIRAVLNFFQLIVGVL